MTGDKEKKVEIDLDYRWENPDISTLINVVRTRLIPFVGEDFGFKGADLSPEN